MSTVGDRLRAATADAHLRLETELDLPHALRTRADLAAVLGRFTGFFRPLEAALAAALGPAAMAGRHRTPDLEADLRALGLAPCAIAALPGRGCARRIGRPAGARSTWLKARGSAAASSRAMKRRDLAHGLRFWTAGPAGGACAWPHFLSALEGVPDAEEAERGALTTFARLHAWMAPRTPRGG